MSNVGIWLEAHDLKLHHLGKTITVDDPLVTITGQLLRYSIEGETEVRFVRADGTAHTVNRCSTVQLTFMGDNVAHVAPTARVMISAAEDHDG